MALDPKALADKINSSLGATDKDNLPIKTTAEMAIYASAVITTLKAGVVINAPGTITGSGSPGGPFSGAGSNGMVTALIPSIWTGVLMSGFPTAPSPTLELEAQLSTAYIMGAAKVSFASGNITGQCGATAESPGPLGAGAGTNGKISGLDGDAWATMLLPVTMGGPLAPKMYGIIAKYIMDNAVVTYPPGTVVGNFPSGGGSIIAGAATGGLIT